MYINLFVGHKKHVSAGISAILNFSFVRFLFSKEINSLTYSLEKISFQLLSYVGFY